MPQRKAKAQDVVACYRAFLGREPESDEVVQGHLNARPRLWDLIEHVRDSTEARRWSIDQACGVIGAQQDTRTIATDASESELALLTDHIREVWSRYGREEPFFSVLTDPAYLSDQLGADDIEDFFGTGQLEVDRFEAVCRRNLVEPDPSWTITELGCGVGRVGEVLASRYASYLGVDISADHLAIARRRFADKGLENTTLSLLEAFLEGTVASDVFLSVIVLQHNPPPIMYQLLDACLGKLRPGGLAYFQIPCHLYDYSFSTTRYMAGDGREDAMELHALPQRDVFAVLARHGLTPIEVTPDSRIGPIGFSYTFLARKLAGGRATRTPRGGRAASISRREA